MTQDRHLQFSDAQSLTVGTTVSTDIVKRAAAAHPFEGEPMGIELTVDVAANTTGGNTYEFILETGATESGGTIQSPTTLITRTIPAAELTAGAIFTIVPPTESTVNVFLGMKYVLVGATSSVTVTAALKSLSQLNQYRPYPAGVTIS